MDGLDAVHPTIGAVLLLPFYQSSGKGYICRPPPAAFDELEQRCKYRGSAWALQGGIKSSKTNRNFCCAKNLKNRLSIDMQTTTKHRRG
eukprot:scaffold4226_cov180-Amphora_coffeaeformis.AAC.8